MSVKEKTYIVDATGETYLIRNQLKALGFRWVAYNKLWQAIGITEKEREIIKTKTWKGVKFVFHSPKEEATPF